ncbi:MAG: hypothetical protein ACRELU_09065 [Gemmatimonadota bacterium]
MRYKALSSVAALMLGLGACSEDPSRLDPTGPENLVPAAGAETFTESFQEPVDILVFIPCANGGAGEDVQLTGFFHVVVHTTINGNRFVSNFHFQPQGVSGEGLASGDKYQSTGVGDEKIRGSFVNGQFSSTFIVNIGIIGQGSGNNAVLHERAHVTINANGEVTASFDNFSAECK